MWCLVARYYSWYLVYLNILTVRYCCSSNRGTRSIYWGHAIALTRGGWPREQQQQQQPEQYHHLLLSGAVVHGQGGPVALKSCSMLYQVQFGFYRTKTICVMGGTFRAGGARSRGCDMYCIPHHVPSDFFAVLTRHPPLGFGIYTIYTAAVGFYCLLRSSTPYCSSFIPGSF